MKSNDFGEAKVVRITEVAERRVKSAPVLIGMEIQRWWPEMEDRLSAKPGFLNWVFVWKGDLGLMPQSCKKCAIWCINARSCKFETIFEIKVHKVPGCPRKSQDFFIGSWLLPFLSRQRPPENKTLTETDQVKCPAKSC